MFEKTSIILAGILASFNCWATADPNGNQIEEPFLQQHNNTTTPVFVYLNSLFVPITEQHVLKIDFLRLQKLPYAYSSFIFFPKIFSN